MPFWLGGFTVVSALVVVLVEMQSVHASAWHAKLSSGGGSKCGDGWLDRGEQCDEGHLSNGGSRGGCTDNCRLKKHWSCEVSEPDYGGRTYCSPARPICGDSFIIAYENCDDGNKKSGDGCDAMCKREQGWTCKKAGARCVKTCGNKKLDSGETCDLGSVLNAEHVGCSEDCEVEQYFSCNESGTKCTATCGDGVVSNGEACDLRQDNGKGKGCTAQCQAEPGWGCTWSGTRSTCVRTCGNGTVDRGEECDDAGYNGGSDSHCSRNCTCAEGWKKLGSYDRYCNAEDTR